MSEQQRGTSKPGLNRATLPVILGGIVALFALMFTIGACHAGSTNTATTTTSQTPAATPEQVANAAKQAILAFYSLPPTADFSAINDDDQVSSLANIAIIKMDPESYKQLDVFYRGILANSGSNDIAKDAAQGIMVIIRNSGSPILMSNIQTISVGTVGGNEVVGISLCTQGSCGMWTDY